LFKFFFDQGWLKNLPNWTVITFQCLLTLRFDGNLISAKKSIFQSVVVIVNSCGVSRQNESFNVFSAIIRNNRQNSLNYLEFLCFSLEQFHELKKRKKLFFRSWANFIFMHLDFTFTITRRIYCQAQKEIILSTVDTVGTCHTICGMLPTRLGKYSSYFFIRIMNIFDLLFEYSNNIRIFILPNKLQILAQNLLNLQNLQNKNN
jgi:hypothetical protein